MPRFDNPANMIHSEHCRNRGREKKFYLTEKMPRLDSVNPTGRGDLLASSAYVQFDSEKIKTQSSWTKYRTRQQMYSRVTLMCDINVSQVRRAHFISN